MTEPMPCPLLTHFKLDRSTCPPGWEENCNTYGCRWGRFHQLDPYTGKPVLTANTTPPGQADLFR